jgi:small subunit ribosomal protein S6
MGATYETIFVLDPSLNEDAVNKTMEKITTFIKEHEGEIFKQENWGKQKLTYLIQKKSEGIYLYLNYTAPPSIVENIRQFLKYEEAVLRNITTKVKQIRRSRFKKKLKGEEKAAEPSEKEIPVVSTIEGGETNG